MKNIVSDSVTSFYIDRAVTALEGEDLIVWVTVETPCVFETNVSIFH